MPADCASVRVRRRGDFMSDTCATMFAQDVSQGGLASPSATILQHSLTVHAEDRDDEILLERICTAYRATVEGAAEQPAEFQPTAWWRSVKSKHLRPVQEALLASDIPSLQGMYRNFFRDRCGIGLIRWPARRGGGDDPFQLDEEDYRVIREDVIHRVNYWRLVTAGRHPLVALRGSPIGNPFGATIDGVFVTADCEYHHACADRIQALTRPGATVVELGGGFGHMAYYLLRDAPKITYVDFDMPETLALAAYFLGMSFPQRRLLLYGERRFTIDAIGASDAILLPPWEMSELSRDCASLTFSSHVLCDMGPAAREAYLHQLARFTKGFVLDIGGDGEGRDQDESVEATYARLFHLVEEQRIDWNGYRAPESVEWERLYCAR
jgi:hypothetical protein